MQGQSSKTLSRAQISFEGRRQHLTGRRTTRSRESGPNGCAEPKGWMIRDGRYGRDCHEGSLPVLWILFTAESA